MKLRLLILAVIVCAFVPRPGPAAQASDKPGAPLLFAETGHTLAYNFRQFYEALDGPLAFGLPLTEVFIEDGWPVQYFERARLEWHADAGEVRIADLGRWAAAGRESEPAFQPVSGPSADATYFDGTGHTLRGAFREFFAQFGGRAVYGLPISEEFRDVDEHDRPPYVVQYFERGRFEFHPDMPWPHIVSLSHLGRQYLATHSIPAWARQPVGSPAQAWDGVRPTHVSVPRIGVNVDVEERGASLGAWDVPHAAVGHFWPVAAYPGTAGNIVLGGHSNYADSIFNHLPQARVGDEVQLTVGDWMYRYRVYEIIVVGPRDTWVMDPIDTKTLTLITCYPLGTSTNRLIVRAEPVR